MKNFFFSIFFISCFSAFSQSDKVKFYDVKTMDQYQQILLKALEDDKMMFAVIYQDGDPFYQMQKDDVFANASLSAAYQATIPIAVDIFSDMGTRFAETFAVDSTPTFYYLSNRELLISVKKGYQSASALTHALTEAQKKLKDYAALQEKYANNALTNSEWLDLLDIYALNFDFAQTMELALEFLNTLQTTDLLSPKIAPVMAKYGIDLETKYPKIIIDNKNEIGGFLDYEQFYESAYSYNFDRAEANKDTVVLEKITTLLIPNNPAKDLSTEELIFETRKVFASDTRMFDVWTRAAISRSESMDNDSLKAEFLFDEAFEIADNFNTEDAQSAARQLAATANDLKADFRYKMLETYMAYLMKDYADANTLMKSAAALALNANDERKAESLQKMITKEMEKAAKETEE